MTFASYRMHNVAHNTTELLPKVIPNFIAMTHWPQNSRVSHIDCKAWCSRLFTTCTSAP